jgi:Ca2+/Na+ antiporter
MFFFFFSTVAVRITLAPFMSADWTFFFFLLLLGSPLFFFLFLAFLLLLSWSYYCYYNFGKNRKKEKKEEEEDLLHGASPSGCRDPWGRSSSHNMTDAIYLPRHKPDLFLIFSFFFLSFSPVENNKKKILRCVYVCKVQEYIGTQTHLETLENGCA